MPIRPSGGKLFVDHCEEYWVAAPNVCERAYDVEREDFMEYETKRLCIQSVHQ
jgi:hypothetical protein